MEMEVVVDDPANGEGRRCSRRTSKWSCKLMALEGSKLCEKHRLADKIHNQEQIAKRNKLIGVGESKRCSRKHTNWRCQEMTMEGSKLCEKHHLADKRSNQLRKMKVIAVDQPLSVDQTGGDGGPSQYAEDHGLKNDFVVESPFQTGSLAGENEGSGDKLGYVERRKRGRPKGSKNKKCLRAVVTGKPKNSANKKRVIAGEKREGMDDGEVGNGVIGERKRRGRPKGSGNKRKVLRGEVGNGVVEERNGVERPKGSQELGITYCGDGKLLAEVEAVKAGDAVAEGGDTKKQELLHTVDKVGGGSVGLDANVPIVMGDKISIFDDGGRDVDAGCNGILNTHRSCIGGIKQVNAGDAAIENDYRDDNVSHKHKIVQAKSRRRKPRLIVAGEILSYPNTVRTQKRKADSTLPRRPRGRPRKDFNGIQKSMSAKDEDIGDKGKSDECSNAGTSVNVLMHTSEVKIASWQRRTMHKLQRKYKTEDMGLLPNLTHTALRSLKTDKAELMDSKCTDVRKVSNNGYFLSEGPSKDEKWDANQAITSEPSVSGTNGLDRNHRELLCPEGNGHSDSALRVGNPTAHENPLRRNGGGSKVVHGGALWDIFRGQDVPKLNDYLKKHWKEFRGTNNAPIESVVHPLHDQTFYFDEKHKKLLKEEFDIEPWTFEQYCGEAVFIPAGCPHQVRNKQCSRMHPVDR